MSAQAKLSQHDIRRISVTSRRDPRTVVMAFEGRATKLATLAVKEAAEALGIPFPFPFPAPAAHASGELSQHDIRRISLACGGDPRTVVKAFEGKTAKLATLAVKEAAEALGIPFPFRGKVSRP